MTAVLTVTCDACGKVKANVSFRGVTVDGTASDHSRLPEHQWQHACSDACMADVLRALAAKFEDRPATLPPAVPFCPPDLGRVAARLVEKARGEADPVVRAAQESMAEVLSGRPKRGI